MPAEGATRLNATTNIHAKNRLTQCPPWFARSGMVPGRGLHWGYKIAAESLPPRRPGQDDLARLPGLPPEAPLQRVAIRKEWRDPRARLLGRVVPAPHRQRIGEPRLLLQVHASGTIERAALHQPRAQRRGRERLRVGAVH